MRGVFHLVNGSLGTHCGQKGQTDTEIDYMMLIWKMEGGNEEMKKKKAFLSFFLNTFMPHYSLCFISTSEGNECMMEVMSFHHECIVRTHCRGPERGACAF